MARGLSALLDAAMLSGIRRPAWSVEVFDIRSTSTEATPTRINDVVRYNLGAIPLLPDIVGPRDFSGDVVSAEVVEVAGDYVDQGIAATSLMLRIVDVRGTLDPVENAPSAGDLEADGRWLRQGNVVVLREGDLAADPEEWPITFTGKIQGQPSQDRNRTTGNSEITLKCASREVDYLRFESTSENFPQSTSYADMLASLANQDMGLDLDEFDFGSAGSAVTQFRSTQFVTESPLTSIAKILFVDGAMPKFKGDGTLGLNDGVISKGPVRTYSTPTIIREITRPILEYNGTNHVTVKGLDPLLSQIVQGRQELARASITTGFFSRDADIPVRWSEDQTQQALQVRMDVISSVGDSIFSFGGESFTNFPQSDGGSVSGRINVDGGLSAGLGLVVLIGFALFASTKIPNIGTGIGAVIVTRTGDFVSFALLQAILAIIGQQGRGEYRITGLPYEYVFEEIPGVVRKMGIRSEDAQQVEIENHLLNSEATVKAAAQRVYRRERAKQNLRDVVMVHDLALEPDDIFAIGTGLDQRQYMIQSIRRTLQRGSIPLASISAFEVTPGVLP